MENQQNIESFENSYMPLFPTQVLLNFDINKIIREIIAAECICSKYSWADLYARYAPTTDPKSKSDVITTTHSTTYIHVRRCRSAKSGT